MGSIVALIRAATSAMPAEGAGRSVPFAVWPANNPCEPGALPVAIDQALFGIVPQDVIPTSPVNAPLSWKSDGSITRVTLAVSGARPVACLTEACVGACDSADGAVFATPVTLSVSTDDGRFHWQGERPLEIVALKGGGLDRAKVDDDENFDSYAALRAATGIDVMSPSIQPPLHLMLRTTLAAGKGAPAPNGYIFVGGVGPPPPCNSGRGCLGSTGYDSVEEATFGGAD